MSELKPCPFCGSEDLVTYYGLTIGYVSCEACKAFGPNGNTRADAIAAWNTRPTQPLCDRIAAEPSGGAVQVGGARGASESSTVQE